MKTSRQGAKLDNSVLPSPTGYREPKRTLCIGLDLAWFGGSKNDPRSRYDFLAVALLGSGSDVEEAECLRVPLPNHDLDAEETVTGLKNLMKKYDAKADRVVLAVDAPLQAAIRGLPVRKPIPKTDSVKRRACEAYLNCKRKSIDNAAGGAKGWHPNIQPGAPLAPRVESLLKKLGGTLKPWTREKAQNGKLIIECFPAEAIWSAKRMGWFATNIGASKAKEYKNQKGKRLTFEKVTKLVVAVLSPFGKVCKGNLWDKRIVSKVLDAILTDRDWKRNDRYPGGKMLDDVVDSLMCLATAISYAAGDAHVWQDLNHPSDGHIIGPGTMQELVTGKTRLA